MSKICTKCKIEKDDSCFVINNDKLKARCKDCDAIYHKEYEIKNKESLKIKSRNKYLKNRNYRIEKAKEWYKNNKERKMQYDCERKYNKYHNDENFNIMSKLSVRLRSAFKTYSKNGKIKNSEEYGINYQKIIEHLGPCPGERKDYHIDHIIPLSAFDFNNLEHIKRAFAPENHQWLKKEDNLKKFNKYNEEEFHLYLTKED